MDTCLRPVCEGLWLLDTSLSFSLSPSFLPSPGMVRWFSLSRALSYHHQAEGFGRRSYEHSPLTRARQLVHGPGKWGLISLACDQSE